MIYNNTLKLIRIDNFFLISSMYFRYFAVISPLKWPDPSFEQKFNPLHIVNFL